MKSVSLAQTYGPAWAVRARNTGGSRRPVNKRHRTAERLGGSSRTMRRLASIPRPGVKRIGFTGGSPARGWRSIPSCSAGGRGAIGWMEGVFVFGLCIGVVSNGRGASMNCKERGKFLRQAVRERVLGAENGVTRTEIAAELGACHKVVGTHLEALRDAGTIAYVCCVARPFWLRAELYAKVVAAVEAEQKASWRKRRTEAERNRRLRKKAAIPKKAKPSHEQRVREVVDLLARHRDGLRCEQVAVISRCGIQTAKKRLSDAMRGGLCMLARFSNANVRWFAVGSEKRIQELRAELQAEIRARRLAARRLADEARKQSPFDFERPCVHSIVPASKARPIRPAGPNSVWALAA